MGFNCGIVGLPNVGKSTLFNAITAAGVDASNYPFCTIDPNVGVVAIPDERITALVRIYQPQKSVPSTIEFVDIAGLVKGASRGEGLGNQFLSHIRDVDAIAHVVRCFDDPNVIHVDGSVNPRRDIEVIEAELIFKDLETVEKKLGEAQKRAKTGDKKVKAEAHLVTEIQRHLFAGRPARSCELHGEDERQWMREMHLLTNKPVMYVCNVHEKEVATENDYVKVVREIAAREGAKIVAVGAEVEAEVAELPAGERKVFLESLGLRESGLDKVVREGYALLELLTFFTTGPKEVHAWTVRKGATTLEAAAVVHSDFAKGFIRAEIIKYRDLVKLGAEQAVKDSGLLHVEGREYRVEDGDIVHIRFSL